MAVSKRLRYEVLRRDNFTCRYCGLRAGEEGTELQVDHVQPVALGGDDKPENLVTACKACNAGKSASSPDAPIVENVADDALRWAAAMKKAAAIQLAQREEVDAVCEDVDKKWRNWYVMSAHGEEVPEDEREPLPRPTDWRQSIERFYAAGLSAEDQKRAIQITMDRPRLYNNKLWRYFCGVCWGMINERQATASGILAVEEEDK